MKVRDLKIGMAGYNPALGMLRQEFEISLGYTVIYNWQSVSKSTNQARWHNLAIPRLARLL